MAKRSTSLARQVAELRTLVEQYVERSKPRCCPYAELPDPVHGVSRENLEKPFERDPAATVVEPTPESRHKELRRGKLDRVLASRLSTLLVNHRAMVETALLEHQISDMRQQLC